MKILNINQDQFVEISENQKQLQFLWIFGHHGAA